MSRGYHVLGRHVHGDRVPTDAGMRREKALQGVERPPGATLAPRLDGGDGQDDEDRHPIADLAPNDRQHAHADQQ